MYISIYLLKRNYLTIFVYVYIFYLLKYNIIL